MKLVEHKESEERPSNAIWWFTLAILALLWSGYLYFHEFEWLPVALGGYTGMALATWAIEITGNKTPEFMKTKR